MKCFLIQITERSHFRFSNRAKRLNVPSASTGSDNSDVEFPFIGILLLRGSGEFGTNKSSIQLYQLA